MAFAVFIKLMGWRVATGSFVGSIGRSNGVVVKVRPRDMGAAERAGYQLIANHLPVPKLLGFIFFGRWSVLLFSKVASVVPGAGLFSDALEFDHSEAVRDTVERHTKCLIDSAHNTEMWSSPIDTTTKLYQDRVLSRLHEWWQPQGHRGLEQFRCMKSRHWNINGVSFSISLDDIFEHLVSWANDETPILTLLSQGDANEMNLAVPLVYLDFKYSGRNALVGEVANFSWSVLGQGPYFAPKYNPTAFLEHRDFTGSALHRRPEAVYQLAANDVIEVAFESSVSAIRRRAISLFLESIWPYISLRYSEAGLDPESALTPYLLARILLTFDPRMMDPVDLILVIASAIQAFGLGGKRYLEKLSDKPI